jgi:CRISPR-associated endonuclease Cas1
VSKKPYDFLVPEKEPLLYLEASILRMEDGFLTVLSGKEGSGTIAPSGVLVLMLGAGTSITQEAAIFAAQNDMQLAFARGRCNVHSIFMSGRYQDPLTICHQVRLIDTQKLEVAKELLRLRLKRNNTKQTDIDEAMTQIDLAALVAWEGRWAKTIYREFSLRNKMPFSRNFDGNDAVNIKLNILNNALYSVCTAICLSCGLHPSVGFLHGYTRRGGLAFDLADVFKTELTMTLAFDVNIKRSRDAMYALAKALKKDNFDIVKRMIKICLLLGGQHKLSWTEL